VKQRLKGVHSARLKKQDKEEDGNDRGLDFHHDFSRAVSSIGYLGFGRNRRPSAIAATAYAFSAARQKALKGHGGGEGKESNLPASEMPAKPVLKTGRATGPFPPPGFSF
jgi:hypothetical protein